MSMKNEVYLEGNLCKDALVINTRNGSAVVKNTIAWNDSYKKGNDWVNVAHFFDITAFGATAESLQQFKKGDLVAVKGNLIMESWDDKETGKKRSKVGVKIYSISPIALNEKKENKNEASKSQPNPATDDDIPF